MAGLTRRTLAAATLAGSARVLAPTGAGARALPAEVDADSASGSASKQGLGDATRPNGIGRGSSDIRDAERPSHFRFALGRFQVTMLLDAAATIDGPWPIVGEDQPRDGVAALMLENRLPPDRFRPGFTPMLVETGTAKILFDAGNGAVGFVPRPAGGRLTERLRAAGHDPAGIDWVVVSHCHTDHIGGLIEAARPAFPNARIAVGATEYDFWSKAERLAGPVDGNEHRSALVFRSHLVPLAERIRFLRPGDEVAPGIHALAAPGHTPGHLAFHVEDDGRRLVAWGDCAHHEVASLARPDWHALFDMDKTAGASTRRRIYDLAAAERMIVAGYHTTFPSLGYVVRDGDGYRWIPVSYQLDL